MEWKRAHLEGPLQFFVLGSVGVVTDQVQMLDLQRQEDHLQHWTTSQLMGQAKGGEDRRALLPSLSPLAHHAPS